MTQTTDRAFGTRLAACAELIWASLAHMSRNPLVRPAANPLRGLWAA